MKRDRLRQYQRRLAPGTPLRAGLDRILHGRTGALVVLGNNAKVQQVSTGGFQLNVDFTPQALRELAKLDGAIILSNDLSRIIAAGVHLVPAGDLPTAETGTRHRSADRTAQASGVPVVTVSASMSTISLFMDGDRHPVETSGQMISRAWRRWRVSSIAWAISSTNSTPWRSASRSRSGAWCSSPSVSR